MVDFAAGELALPVRKILWAPTNAAHFNHLHVEGPHVNGTLQQCTSKWTEAITTIRGALDGQFGLGDHYQVWDDTLGWTHMGVYNCRNIAGTNIPSQHAFSNAIDIGPYYGVAQQQKFYDFLTRKEDEDMPLTQADADLVVNTLLARNLPIASIAIGTAMDRNYRNVNELTVAHRKGTLGVDLDLSEADIQAIADAIEAKGIAEEVALELGQRLTKPVG